MNKIKMKLKEVKEKNAIVVNKLNYDVLNKIVSHSPYSWHELYYVNANNYNTCLQVFDYPKFSTNDFLKKILNDSNVYVTLDIDHMGTFEYTNHFDKTIKKNYESANDSKSLFATKKKLEQNEEMKAFDNYIQNSKEEVKTVTLRIYISESTLEKLQAKVDEVIVMLANKKMKGYIQTNDLETDVLALTDFSNPVKKMVASSTIADMLLRSEVSAVDLNGSLIGYTASGVYCPDLFNFRNNSYNYVLMGGMGAGKSAFLKALEEGYYCMGNHVLHLFDVHGEYRDYARMLKIPTVAIDNRNTINACQIFYTVDDSGIITETDITSRIGVLTETFKTSANESRKNVIDWFEKEVKAIYNEKMLNKNIHELKNEDWFTLEDIQKRIEEKWNNKEYEDVATQDIYNLRLSLGNMMDKYGFIYNQKTNMEFDLTKSLVFDISYFKNLEDKKIKNAYVSLLMDYIGMAVRINLERNQEIMKEKGVHIYDMTRPFITYRLIVDETLDYAEDSSFMLKTINLLKYMRKAYAGAGFVVHTYDETRKKVSAGANEESYLSQLFSLCTNKFVGKTDGESLNDLPNVVKQMNNYDVSIMSKFEKGAHGERPFLIIDDQNRKFYITSIVNKFQQEYFGGGA